MRKFFEPPRGHTIAKEDSHHTLNRTETANAMAKKITKEIFLRFGMPKVIVSDNRPAFVAQVSQGMAKTLGIN